MSYWSIAKLVWPLALGMANNAVMQFIDRVYLSHESMRALEAVMPASTLAWVFLSFFQAVVGYSGVFVAQCHGAGDTMGGRRCFRAGEWTAVLSVALLLPLVWAGDALFSRLATVPELVSMECAYYEVVMLGGFFLLAQTASASYFTGIGKTRLVFWVSLIGNLANIAVDPLLIFGYWGFPKMGIVGAAWATVLSQALQYLLLRVAISREFRRHPAEAAKGGGESVWSLMKRILRFGCPSGGFEVLNMLSFTIFVFMTGRLGELESAVSNACFTINWLLFAPLLGFSIGAQTLVGQFCGRKDTVGASKVLGKALRLGLAFQIVLFVAVLLFHNPILALFTPPEAQGDPRFAELGFQLLGVMSVWMLFDAVDVIVTGGLKGAGDTRFVFWWMLVGSFLVWIPLSALVLWLGGSMVHLWMTGIPYILVLVLGSTVRWCRGKWRTIGPLVATVVLLLTGLASVFFLRSGDVTRELAFTTTARGTALCGINFGHKPSAAEYSLMKEAGVRVVAHHYGEGLLVEADPSSLDRLARDGAGIRLRSVSVTEKIQEKVNLTSPEAQLITVAPLAAEDFPVLERTVQDLGGSVLARMGVKDGVPRLQVMLPGTSIVRLAEIAEVSWIENRTRPQLMNDIAVSNTMMNVEQARTEHGLSGRGQVITTSDSGIDGGLVKQPMHEDLRENVIGFACVESTEISTGNVSIAPLDVTGHGTHTAGSLVGSGACSNGRIKGVAYEAKLWAWFGSDGKYLYLPDDYADTFRPSALGPTNSYIHSASWGGACNVYDTQSQAIDTWCWNHPDFLPVFAAGNGGVDCSVNAEGGAKNVLCVGSTESDRALGETDSDNPDALARHSSRGPMPDGRIKPDICAPGTYILSTRSSVSQYTLLGVYDDYYIYNSGTSMSTPLVAGTVALIRQWLVEQAGFTNRAPSAALMKAIITGGATRLGSGVPNKDFGWGRVNLTDTVFPVNGTSVALRDHIAFCEGSRESFTVTTTNAAPLDVQLCWVDYPAAPQSSDSQTLVVDLDLVVSNLQTGVTYMPDDHVNNLEAVHLDLAEPGTYQITVCGYSTAGHSSEEGGAAAVYLRGAFGNSSADESDETVTTGAVFSYAPVSGGPEYDIPHDWLVAAGLASYGDSVEDVPGKLAAPYAPGYTGWEAYVAGLTATNETFRAEITTGPNGVVYVSWRPNLNTGAVKRIYRVLGRTELGTGEWDQTARPGHRFFKVDVSMPTGAAGEETDVSGAARGNIQ